MVILVLCVGGVVAKSVVVLPCWVRYNGFKRLSYDNRRCITSLIIMVKLCVLCGNVDGLAEVSLHRFPANDELRRLWVLFAVNNGVNAQQIIPTSKLCSRHFVPGQDFTVGAIRRRHLSRAVPSLVVQNQPDFDIVPAGGEQGGDENEVEVQINDDNIEVIVVQMDNVQEEMVLVNIEYVDLLPADAEAVFEFRDIFDVFLSDVDEEFIPIPMLDRPAGIQQELPEKH
ncbi:THAP-type domain-containing protein [Aphis craccivora]|uniref:THAP-type domain-containing protein n=1 Tax=Aphis craccivora TaxID=307492 RepID=A0A6G0W8T9_APHCR|nr:THAP-type domain-containing protein [Aphis craccivora]